MISIMKEYISTIIYIAIFSIILELVLPNSKMKKYIATLISLLVVIVILSPIVDVITNNKMSEALSGAIETISSNSMINSEENSYDFGNYKDKIILQNTKSEMEKEINKYITDNLNDIVKISTVKVTLKEDYTLSEIKIYIEIIVNNKINKISKLISRVSEEYNIPKELIRIIEEGSWNGKTWE